MSTPGNVQPHECRARIGGVDFTCWAWSRDGSGWECAVESSDGELQIFIVKDCFFPAQSEQDARDRILDAMRKLGAVIEVPFG